MEFIKGGVTAPKGFKANGVHCGIRKNKTKKDLALIVADDRCVTASVYTTNLVKGAPIAVTKKNIADGYAQAIICNSGNANTCNANGVEIAEKMCLLVEKHTGIKASDVIVASTGVIGQPLDITPIENGMQELVAGLGDNSLSANQAIMTTDTIPKEVALSFKLGGKTCKIGCIAKGSGMIHPNMATMLVFVTTDVNITPEMLSKAVKNDVKTSFNMVSVDGDTSTNDMLSVMASGKAGNKLIDSENELYLEFITALNKVTTAVCRMIAQDGEGATKLLECKVKGAKTDGDAQIIAKSVICSSLLKAAMFGADANWGRVLCAIGYSNANVDINKISVAFASAKGIIKVCIDGAGLPFDEGTAKTILSEKEIEILIDCYDGDGKATAWGCDLTYDYVKINGDYRT
jgi:glutamate N-acetyltransferase/amino-acid N-acetyltransferase